MKTYFVDSFTNEKFKGNPAAVCIIEKAIDELTMQHIATEIGFSETAFISKRSDASYNIRFFSPRQEIPLCGHATLAASKILFDTAATETITFINHGGVVLEIKNDKGKIVMQFPVYDMEDIDVPIAMLNAIGIKKFIDSRFSPNNNIILLEIESVATLADLQPDFVSLVASYTGINGVLVTAASADDEFDFHYRYFWPWSGTNEDPVTGGVQTFLTKYWALKLNKTTFKAFQSSLRTGKMNTELLGDKVLIYGEAVTILAGEFNL